VSIATWGGPVFVLTFALVACHGQQARGVGVELDAQGNVVVLTRTCKRDAVETRVQLLDTKGTRGDGSDDLALWTISLKAGSGTRRFVVGETPAGYTEDVVFAGLPKDGRLLRIAVESSELPQGESVLFTVGQLRHDRVLLADGETSEDEFMRGNACD
jgi:hypothetical protein